MRQAALFLVTGLILAVPQVQAQTAPAPAAPPAQTAPPPPPVALAPRAFSPRSPQSFATLIPVDAGYAQSKRYEQTYQQVQQYGRCATNVTPRRAATVLGAAPNTRTELVELRQLIGVSRGCLPYGYGAPVVFLRGGLAEALYRQQPAAAAVHAGGTTSADLSAFLAAEAARSKARLPADRDFTTLSNCLVVRAPGAVRTVLESRHGSSEEGAALDAVLAASPGCATTRRFPGSASRSFVRAYLAESAYRWASFDTARRG